MEQPASEVVSEVVSDTLVRTYVMHGVAIQNNQVEKQVRCDFDLLEREFYSTIRCFCQI